VILYFNSYTVIIITSLLFIYLFIHAFLKHQIAIIFKSVTVNHWSQIVAVNARTYFSRLVIPEKFTHNLETRRIEIHLRHARQCLHDSALEQRQRRSTVRHPSDSFETPNSTINYPWWKVFGIEKVSAKLLPPFDADGHSDFRRTYRENTDRTSTKRAFHSALNKNMSNPK